MLFDQFKQLLALATTSTEFQAKNVVMQDATFSGLVSSHIAALSPDFNIRLNSTNVLSATGLLENNTLTRKMQFLPKGTEKLSLGYLERNIETPVRMWARPAETDGRRYIIADSAKGVLFSNDKGEINGAVPGYGTTGGYDAPASAITFTVSSVEYLAIAMPTHNIVRVFDMATFAVVSTIGVYNAPGLPGGNLDTPVDLAFDAATSTLYICSDTGVAPTGTGVGYIASYDLTTPATPAFGSYIAINAGGALLHGQVSAPKNIVFDSVLNALWVTSHTATTPEVGAISVAGLTTPGYLVAYLETRGIGYDIVPSGMWLTSNRKLYVSAASTVEVFDVATLKHVRTYGQHAIEDTVTDTSTEVDLDFGALSSIVVDTVTIGGVSVTTLMVGDSGNRRIVRFSENTFDQDSYITFNSATFGVPVAIHGYLLQGSIPAENVVLEYRTSATGLWQVLSGTDDVPGVTFLQFRLRVRLSSGVPLQSSYDISHIIVVGEQE